MGMITLYNVEYTIQETICPKSAEEVTAEKCPLMKCEFSVSGIKRTRFKLAYNFNTHLVYSLKSVQNPLVLVGPSVNGHYFVKD